MNKEYICQRCGITFNSDKGYKSRTPKFCSKYCYSNKYNKQKIVNKCLVCSSEIVVYNKNYIRKTCSTKCMSILASKRITYKCEHCNISFYSNKGCKTRNPKFCSKLCYSKSLEKEGKKYICEYCGNEFIKKNRSRIIKYCSKDCFSKSASELRLGKPNGRCGEKSGLWKGGVTKPNEAARKTRKYSDWRISVFERDNYTCVHCGIIGGKLQADHIKPFSTHKELRFDINNGRTLCIDCHKKTDTYGGKMIKNGIQKTI